ncbi:MAG: hypothetical protein HZA46_15255 [Planctomycetales bacterium]|nr:hypothetical protein [Planctomycetales bacterium]
MSLPLGWVNPITEQPGQIQHDVDPTQLRPGRTDLAKSRLEWQRHLMKSGIRRYTPIQVNRDAIINDGHHAERAAAEEGWLVEVLVIEPTLVAVDEMILDLPVEV